jgi:hypothetical protein
MNSERIGFKHIVTCFLSVCLLKVNAQDKSNDISFVQGDKTVIISKNVDSVVLDRKNFSIRYFGKKYEERKGVFFAAQVAVLIDSKDIGKISVGTRTEDIPYFSTGTAIAADTDTSYNEAYINNEGNNYLFYENEKDRRVKLIYKEKDLLELEWTIPAFYYKEKEIQFSELEFPQLYFVFFIDRNRNEAIDKNEVKIITVSFR